eukprot:2821896-Pleurochrysis_carterae.AAC.1
MSGSFGVKPSILASQRLQPRFCLAHMHRPHKQSNSPMSTNNSIAPVFCKGSLMTRLSSSCALLPSSIIGPNGGGAVGADMLVLVPPRAVAERTSVRPHAALPLPLALTPLVRPIPVAQITISQNVVK